MKLWVYLNSAFLLRAAIGFSRRLTLAGEASYSFSLYSIICCISCTYFHLMLVSGSFRKKPPHPRFFYYPVSSKNEGNLEGWRQFQGQYRRWQRRPSLLNRSLFKTLSSQVAN